MQMVWVATALMSNSGILCTENGPRSMTLTLIIFCQYLRRLLCRGVQASGMLVHVTVAPSSLCQGFSEERPFDVSSFF